MLAGTEVATQHWLSHFEHVLTARDDSALKSLFHHDSYWRDALAFTWTIKTVHGVGAIVGGMQRIDAVQALTLFALRAVGVADARARGLVVQVRV